MKLLMIGAGGHAQLVIDAILSSPNPNELEIVGILDDDPSLRETSVLGIPVIGDTERLDEVPHDRILISIGNNNARAVLFKALKLRSEVFQNVVHRTAVLGTDTEIGQACVFSAGCVVNTGSKLEDNVILSTLCGLGHHNFIGSHSHIGPGAHLGGNVAVGEGALLGVGCSVIPGVTIGEWSIVGAGSVVLEDVPPHVTVAGVPARIVRRHRDEPVATDGTK